VPAATLHNLAPLTSAASRPIGCYPTGNGEEAHAREVGIRFREGITRGVGAPRGGHRGVGGVDAHERRGDLDDEVPVDAARGGQRPLGVQLPHAAGGRASGAEAGQRGEGISCSRRTHRIRRVLRAIALTVTANRTSWCRCGGRRRKLAVGALVGLRVCACERSRPAGDKSRKGQCLRQCDNRARRVGSPQCKPGTEIRRSAR
jgi:hypothetical protein